MDCSVAVKTSTTPAWLPTIFDRKGVRHARTVAATAGRRCTMSRPLITMSPLSQCRLQLTARMRGQRIPTERREAERSLAVLKVASLDEVWERRRSRSSRSEAAERSLSLSLSLSPPLRFRPLKEISGGRRICCCFCCFFLPLP